MSPVPPTDRRAVEALREIDDLLRGSPRDAWRRMCFALALEPTLPTAEAVAAIVPRLDAVEAGLAEQRVALLTNVTIEPLVPLLVAHGISSGIAIQPYVPGFDTWAQEIADPSSGLRRHDPEVVVLNLRLEGLASRLSDEFLALTTEEVEATIAATMAHVERALSTLRRWSRARLIIHTFARPLHPTLGIIDRDRPSGQEAAIAALNQRLAALAGEIGDAYLVDTDRLRARLGEARWHDARMWALAKMPYGSAALHALAHEYLRLLRAMTGRVRKVLLLDADDTLWGGILGEVGAEGLALGDRYPGSAFVDVQRAVLEWHRRGVILGLVSRNDEADVMRVLEEHPAMLLRPQHFAAHRINWSDKAANVADLVEELGLAIDSVVFVDDSRIECDRMRQALPEVMTLHLDGEPAYRAAAIRSLGVFDSLSYGPEDRSRGAKYRTEFDRRTLQRELPSLEDFYQSLEMALTIERVSDDTIARAADLTQRTNQFNLHPRRFTRQDLAAELAVQGVEGYVFRLRDRFGDYGVIGVAMVDVRAAAISQLLLSCRVLKRTVEDSVLAFLVERARSAGGCDVSAAFLPAPRNGLVAEFLTARGFTPTSSETDRVIRYRLAADAVVPFSPWVDMASPVERAVR